MKRDGNSKQLLQTPFEMTCLAIQTYTSGNHKSPKALGQTFRKDLAHAFLTRSKLV